MKMLDRIYRLLSRFRYPVSMPEDVARDLGLNISNYVTFSEFINSVIDPLSPPKNLARYMSRDIAEGMFCLARKKEKFKTCSLFSYHFKDGWMEFILQFDNQSQLRRLYICHKHLKEKREISIS